MQHPVFSRASYLKNFFPGFGIAVVAFSAYVLADNLVHPTNLAAIKQAAKDDLEGKSLVVCLLFVNCKNVCSLVYAGHTQNGSSGRNCSAARAGEAAVAYSKGGIEGMRQTKAFKLLQMSNCNNISACFDNHHSPILR